MGAETGQVRQAHRHLRPGQRHSSASEKREPSTEGQVAVCRVRLAELGLEEGKVLIDPGRSAWNPAVKREAWDELMDRLERGVSGGVIVFDLERLQPAAEGRRADDRPGRHAGCWCSTARVNTTCAPRTARRRSATPSTPLPTTPTGCRPEAPAARSSRRWQASRTARHRPFGFEADLVTIREDEAADHPGPDQAVPGGGNPGRADRRAQRTRRSALVYGKPWTRASLRQS